MNADALPRTAWRAARRRDAAIVAAFGLPWLAACVAMALRWAGPREAALAVAAGVVAIACVAAWRWRARDARWLVRALDAQRPDMEDSADLLLSEAAPSSLQHLQRQRLQQRLAARPPDLRAAWPQAALRASSLGAVLVLLASLSWQRAPAALPSVGMPVAEGAASVAGVAAHAIAVRPPAYTGLPARSETALSLKAPLGSTLRWRLRLSAPQARAALVFTDGRRIPLAQVDGEWTATLRLAASALYRIEIDGHAPDGKPHRLEAIADRPPQVRATEPSQALSQAAPRQRTWSLRFIASDDYGVAAGATLRITTASGSGENIAFLQREIGVAGRGPAIARRFAHALDLAALGLEPGDEVVARLVVRDNRSPQPQEAQSPGLVLRLASAQDVQASDLEASIKRVMPAYFRSQRQIILDAEALLKQRRRLDADTFVKRSDAIGVDQRILRLRYGQFLGEEAEGGPKPPPTNDAPDAAHADGDHEADHAHEHGAADAGGAAAFGDGGDVLAEFGHTHDHAEAATLLDPQTRATLKQALDQMWQSEGALRQGHPEQALPHAYRALGFIKQVQQAERIYLARVGPDLPPIDESRRMTGKRDGLASRSTSLQPAGRDDDAVVALWRALAETPAPDAAVDMAGLQGWMRAHPTRVPDPLAVQSAIDVLQRTPACGECRAELRALLWPLLRPPPAAVPRRTAADALGQRYLDALDQDASR